MTDEPTLEQLRVRARELDVPGRTKMDRDELAAAIAEAEAQATGTAGATTDTGERHADAQSGAQGAQDDDQRTVEQLLEAARELDVAGRSSMDRAELVAAVTAAEAERAAAPAPGSTTPGGEPPTTAGQLSTAGLAAVQDNPQPGTPDEVGRPDLIDLATSRAADRRPARVVGTDPAETQE